MLLCCDDDDNNDDDDDDVDDDDDSGGGGTDAGDACGAGSGVTVSDGNNDENGDNKKGTLNKTFEENGGKANMMNGNKKKLDKQRKRTMRSN